MSKNRRKTKRQNKAVTKRTVAKNVPIKKEIEFAEEKVKEASVKTETTELEQAEKSVRASVQEVELAQEETPVETVADCTEENTEENTEVAVAEPVEPEIVRNKDNPTVIFKEPHVPDTTGLRDYQAECLSAIEKAGPGSHLCVLATALGKTYIFSHIPRYGRVLLLSHREELVHQPQKYYDCSFGVERADEHSHREEVVSASVQTMVRRLHQFDPYDFDMIITDEAHHAVAGSYQKIYDYFKPRVHIGFTATPDRNDKADLNKIFDDIIYYKNIKYGISNNYLCDINCIRVDVGYDLRKVHKQMGDFKQDELGDEMSQPIIIEAIGEAYRKFAKGATIIFAVNVKHAELIAEQIPGAVVVTGETKNREQVIADFTARKIPCLVNCMVFTEGTDMPLIETVIIARPTHNLSLYTQMVGRGLRLHPDKKFLTLIDCVGVTGRLNICTAPNLFGLGTDVVDKPEKLQGMLSEMPKIVERAADTPKSWIASAKQVSLFAQDEDLDLCNVKYMLMPDNSLLVSAGNGISVLIPESDARNQTVAIIRKQGRPIHMHELADRQKVLEDVYDYLSTYCADSRVLWDGSTGHAWENQMCSEKQIGYMKGLFRQCGRPWEEDLSRITKKDAGIVIERLKYEIQNGQMQNAQ